MSRAIGFDQNTGSLVIVGRGVFPAKTLIASVGPDGVTIQVVSLAQRVEFAEAWSTVTDLSGAGFPDLPTTLAYLQGEFAKGPVVGSPERSYALPAASGQPVFPIAPEPVDVNTVALMINGVAYYPPDTAVSALAVTWQGPFPLEPTDALRVAYF